MNCGCHGFSLPLRLGEAETEGIVAGRSWVSFLGLGLWWFGWSGVMARGKAVGALSSSCPCWGADHLWTIVAQGTLVTVGPSLWVSLLFRTGGGEFQKKKHHFIVIWLKTQHASVILASVSF